MDDFVRNKLIEWGLSEWIQNFEGKLLPCFFVVHRCYCNGADTCAKALAVKTLFIFTQLDGTINLRLTAVH